MSKRPITDAAFIVVDAGVRYWEDATVDLIEDNDGTLIPFRVGDRWRPTIRIADGVILDWPSGTVARVHYKVCDNGTYQLLDAERRPMASIGGYVPNCLSPGDRGYGDYIILDIDGAGRIAGWEAPTDYADDGAWETT